MVLGIIRLITTSAALIAACVIVSNQSSVMAAEQQFTYRVEMSPYGTIGTYRNTVRNDNNEITITTEAQIKVSVVGVALYRLDISRVERRVGDRLIFFRGLTTENGKPVEVTGSAVGTQFVINSPHGSVTAPGIIRASDPWSVGLLGSNLVFMPDTGAVTRVHASGGERTSITIDGAPVGVRHYQIHTEDGGEQYEVWKNDHDIPVMFNIADRDGTTIFTITR